VALEVLGRVEFDTQLAQGGYQTFLRRAADPAGLSAAVNALERGARDEAILAGILLPPEYSSLI
jgi:hypothetical protein